MQAKGTLLPLPISWKECQDRGWQSLDVLLVTGDAYIDHPSFGVALIGRLLESRGYKVAILAQPAFDSPADFKQFPTPTLFCGITAGNLDSIVANYSGNGKVRDTDAYSPDGNPWRGKEREKKFRRRPDRASIIYSTLAKNAFKNTPIILGGVEASLRRFVHYDYKLRKLRGSILTDAKADLLVYGMGEHAILEAAARLQKGHSFDGIYGTCIRLPEAQYQERYQTDSQEQLQYLPSWQDINTRKELFLEAELAIDKHARAGSSELLVQKQQSFWVIQYPPSSPLSTDEFDDLSLLPYTRQPHPAFKNIPAYRMIRDSITIVRGCSGNCSFCAITRHQGTVVSSRSIDSVLTEVTAISKVKGFSGTISDLGGPTANLYKTGCNHETCNRHDCLFPRVCKNLTIDENSFLELLRKVTGHSAVKHVFISSGLRMELLRKTPKLLKKIIREHTPGSIKIAPEHTEHEVLQLMHKEEHRELELFVAQCRNIGSPKEKQLQISPYIISAHPGCTEAHTKKMVSKLKKLGLVVRGFQDFTPTPGSISTAMYYSGIDRIKRQPLHIPGETDRKRQRAIMERAFFKTSSEKIKQTSPVNRKRRRKNRK